MSITLSSGTMYIRDKSTGDFVPITMVSSGAGETIAAINAAHEELQEYYDAAIEQSTKILPAKFG